LALRGRVVLHAALPHRHVHVGPRERSSRRGTNASWLGQPPKYSSSIIITNRVPRSQ
jgi:diadenosine tetraphosphate (Ap4A) HIT family hydrolase